MKIAKKITGLLLVMSLLITICPTVAYAASGRVSFTDLTSEAGEEFVIKISVTSETEEIDSIQVVMDYDDEAIQFLSGANVTAADGVLTYETEASGTSAYTEVTFLALKFGSTSITISDVTVIGTSGATIDMTEGNSAIVVEGGTETEAVTLVTGGYDTVTIDGVEYTISTDDLSSMTPEGYSQTTFEYNGSTYYAVEGDESGILLAGLVDASGECSLFYYDDEIATFYPYVQVVISDSTAIIFLQTDIDEELPEQYVETVLTVNGFEYPTWEDMDNTGYYLIHAINTFGEEGIYQYDTSEQTYQKFVVPEVEEVEIVEATFAEEFVESVGEYLEEILVGILALFLLLIIILIILGVKLSNRNNELDDLYAGKANKKKEPKKEIKKETKKETKKEVKKEPRKVTKKEKVEPIAPVKKTPAPIDYDNFDDDDEFFDDDFDDSYDEKYDDGFHDYDYDDDFDDFDDDYDDDFDDDEFLDDDDDFDDFDDDFLDDDFDDEEDYKRVSKVNRKKDIEDDLDFIDL